MIKHWPKALWKGKGWFHLTTPRSQSITERSWGRNLEAGIVAETMEKYSLLAWDPGLLSYISCTAQVNLLKNWASLTVFWTFTQQTLTKKMPHKSVWWRQFLKSLLNLKQKQKLVSPESKQPTSLRKSWNLPDLQGLSFTMVTWEVRLLWRGDSRIFWRFLKAIREL